MFREQKDLLENQLEKLGVSMKNLEMQQRNCLGIEVMCKQKKGKCQI